MTFVRNNIISKVFCLEITFVRSGLRIPNMVYLNQIVCLSGGVNLKVVTTSIAEIDRPVYHDVRNSMPHPMCSLFLCVAQIGVSWITIQAFL